MFLWRRQVTVATDTFLPNSCNSCEICRFGAVPTWALLRQKITVTGDNSIKHSVHSGDGERLAESDEKGRIVLVDVQREDAGESVPGAKAC